jgi:pimeloyl-ACP methyl ester carboxylesterase
MSRELLPLVLIHGYPLDHTMWFGVIAAFGAGVRTIAPDLRGFGKSATPPEGEPAIEAYAREILRQLEADNIPRAVIAGMSMGGYVGLALAEIAREKVAGLAMINSQCFADTEEARKGRRELIQKVRERGPSVAAQAAIPKMFAASRTSDPDFQRFVIQGADAAGIEGISWALEAMARRTDRSHILTDALYPTLVLHSDDDQFIPVEKARKMSELNPATHFVSLKNAGHAAAIEAPDEVANTLRKFLELCSRSSETRPAEPATPADVS